MEEKMKSYEYREGYDAGLEFHLGNGIHAENPFPYDSQEYKDWEEGFIDAGLDS